MEGDISKALTYQVKREIAERYFGTRKLIESDIAALADMVQRIKKKYETGVGRGLVRIYSLLMTDDLIKRLLEFLKWDGYPFHDSYVAESETIRKRLLEKLHSHGWLQKSRFINMVIDSYRLLYREYMDLREMMAEAEEEIAVIREELKIFKNKYSLEEIMSFVRNLDFQGQDMAKVLGSGVNVLDPEELAGRIDLGNIDELAAQIPAIPDLPKPEDFEEELQELAAEAYSLHPELAASAVSMADR